MNPHITYKLPKKNTLVKRVLIIRLQATGDVVIMLPYIQSLREQLPPNTRIDLLTRQETESIPKGLTLFNKVYALGGARNTKLQLLSFLLLYPRLLFTRYNVLFDLQNHNLSHVIRFLLGIKTFSVFDRTSSNYAGNRYKNTINMLDICKVEFKPLSPTLSHFPFNIPQTFIVINPAGAFETRNWAIDNYVAFCELWLKEVNKNATFVILGITKIKDKAIYLKEKLGDALIDLVDKTTPIEAMQIVSKAKLVVSEDGGLLHISYATGTPTIGILGSTRNDWTNPLLPHTYFFNSADMPCGNCMITTCKFAEVKCLTRIKPDAVLQAALGILRN